MRLGAIGMFLLFSPGLYAADGTVVDEALAGKVVGIYAIRSNLATVQKLPVIGNSSSLSSTFSLLQISRSGEGLIAEEQACRIQITGSSSIVQSVPDALPQSIPVQSSTFRIWQDADTLNFVKDPVATVLGARLTDPETESLPTKATDARVFDQDGDGHPGVTVKVTSSFVNGEIYLVQRLKNSWTGTVNAEGRLSALLQDSGEQSIVDASSAVLKSKVPVSNDPDASKSNVSFVRLNETYDCARLIQEAGSLFTGL